MEEPGHQLFEGGQRELGGFVEPVPVDNQELRVWLRQVNPGIAPPALEVD